MRPGPLARLLLGLIRVYQLVLSPWLGRACRYQPTCSVYAADAIRRHGAWAGGWMGAARLCRCHPWGGSGYDPAPGEKPNAPLWAPWRLGDWDARVRPVPDPPICERVQP
jgi:putative membrane protein insertion efficiency factor